MSHYEKYDYSAIGCLNRDQNKFVSLFYHKKASLIRFTYFLNKI
jgi:hypothetical protein